jgi:filamentous hemagglutinin family protein
MPQRPDFWPSFLLASLTGAAHAAGGIATDGTVGGPGALGNPRSLTGQNLTIPESLGSKVGKNLFQSFKDFNVNTGQTVTFTENTPNSLDNVVTRVTGQSGTDIDGTLRSTPGGHADFYLVNPNGVAFGKGARVDVPAAFHVSTADELRFKDGGKFSAVDPNSSTLSSAPPAAFGFLGTSKANNGLLKIDGAQLAVKPGKTLDLVAGQINFGAAAVPAGEIRLVAMRGKGEASLARGADGMLPLPAAPPSDKNAGQINAGIIDTSGEGGGRIGIWGGSVGVGAITANNTGSSKPTAARTVEIRASTLSAIIGITAQPQGSGKGGDIEVETTQDLALNFPITTSGFAASNGGDAGKVTLKTGGDLTIGTTADALFQQAGIFTESAGGPSQAGNISIATGGNLLIGPLGTLDASTGGAGNGGDVSIQTRGSLSLEGGSITSAARGGTGNAGLISINAKGSLNFKDGGLILTSAFGDGQGGRVKIATGGDLRIDRGRAITGIFSRAEPGSVGNAGDIDLHVGGNLSIDGNSNVRTGIFSQAAEKSTGNAGSITLVAQGALTVRGEGIASSTAGRGSAGAISVEAANITLDGGAITAAALPGSSGQTAGLSVIAHDSLSLANISRISLKNDGTAAQPGALRSGNLNVQAAKLNLDDSEITAATTGNVDAGSVTIKAQALSASNASIISSSTAASGSAGQVTVNAGTLSLDHSDITAAAMTGSTGRTNDVTVTASDSASLVNSSRITIQNDGTAPDPAAIMPGTLSATAPSLSLDGSLISAATTGNAQAGQVSIAASSFLSAIRGATITSSTSGSGAAGNVSVTAGALSLDHAAITAEARQGSGGQTGSVSVAAGSLLRLADGGSISVENRGSPADPGGVPGGKLSVRAPTVELDNGIITAQTTGSAPAGSVTVQADLSLLARNGSSISSSTVGSGAAGSVDIAAGTLTLDGSAVSAAALENSGGQTGSVTVNAADSILLANAGKISIENAGQASDPTALTPGMLTVTAPALDLAGGSITAATSGNVGAGSVSVNVAGNLSARQGAAITSATSGQGAAGSVAVGAARIDLDNAAISAEAQQGSGGRTGDVTVRASQSLTLDPGGAISIANRGTASDPGAVRPGQVKVDTPALTLRGGSITAATSGNVGAGSVSVNVAGNLSARQGAAITSATSGQGAAGSVAVGAARIDLDNAAISAEAQQGSGGRTGDVTVRASQSLTLDPGGAISIANRGTASDPGAVRPGQVKVDTPALTLRGGSITAATSGNVGAGSVTVKVAGTLAASRSAAITSATSGQGAAGSVRIDAARITLDRASVSAAAGENSGGQTGDVTVNARESLSLADGAEISIANAASAADPKGIKAGRIQVSAPLIALSGSQIKTDSTGNIAAGDIGIDFGQSLALSGESFISTTANTGNGGSIAIQGGGTVTLGDSGIRTSVKEGKGDGGDITVQADTLFLLTGQIQADANSGNGGDIALNVRNFVPSGNTLNGIEYGTADAFAVRLAPGAWRPYEFGNNVVQAVSLSGVSGTISLAAPQLNLSGALANLGNPRFDSGLLGADYCALDAESALTVEGQGALPRRSRELLLY